MSWLKNRDPDRRANQPAGGDRVEILDLRPAPDPSVDALINAPDARLTRAAPDARLTRA